MDPKELRTTLQEEQHLTFYKIMKYPVPKQAKYFLFDENTKKQQTPLMRLAHLHKTDSFSRTASNPYLAEYIAYIEKWQRVYRSIPWVQSIYLCNSITFNALQEDSDIDLFIVAKKGALWRARFFSELYFRLLGLKRGVQRNTRKKFCLSFYVTADNQNMYPISLPNNDIYLTYRLAHLVPLYQESYENIYKHNKWINSLLPHFPGKYSINLGTQVHYGRSGWKSWQEFWEGGLRGRLLEKLIRLSRLPLVIYKKNKLGAAGRGIIINDHMLKFHRDARKKIHLLYKVYSKKYSSKRG